MFAKLIAMLSRPSRRPLALGVVLVSARGGNDARPICYAQLRPASAWSAVLLLLGVLGIGTSAVQREAELSAAAPAAATAKAAAEEPTSEAETRFVSNPHPNPDTVFSIRRC